MFSLNVLVIMAAVGDYRFGILDVEYCIIIYLTFLLKPKVLANIYSLSIMVVVWRAAIRMYGAQLFSVNNAVCGCVYLNGIGVQLV